MYSIASVGLLYANLPSRHLWTRFWHFVHRIELTDVTDNTSHSWARYILPVSTGRVCPRAMCPRPVDTDRGHGLCVSSFSCIVFFVNLQDYLRWFASPSGAPRCKNTSTTEIQTTGLETALASCRGHLALPCRTVYWHLLPSLFS